LEGIILAGGYSSRLERNKMTLLYNNKPIICNVIDSMKVHCDKIIVVTGHYHDEIVKAVEKYNQVIVVKNEEYHLGMFSSVKTGVKEVKNDFFLTPGDYPLIKSKTYKKLIEETGVIRVPTFNKRKGHPIFISKSLIDSLKKEHIDSNLKIFRDRHIVNYVETDDKGILIDVDTIEDYEYLKGIKERNDI